jgi:hypothetical protein
MTKNELIKAMESFGDDEGVIIGDSETGWSNIEEVKSNGSVISIMQDMTRPFSGD